MSKNSINFVFHLFILEKKNSVYQHTSVGYSYSNLNMSKKFYAVIKNMRLDMWERSTVDDKFSGGNYNSKDYEYIYEKNMCQGQAKCMI